MPLIDLNLEVADVAMPGDVRSFLRAARRRIQRFQQENRVSGFVRSDFQQVYGVLHALAAANLAPGNLFCEWGSGFGVVACLAAMLDFDACGIEIETGLVDAAQQLADDFELPVEYLRASFIPRGGEAYVDVGDGFVWLTGQVLASRGCGRMTGKCAADFRNKACTSAWSIYRSSILPAATPWPTPAASGSWRPPEPVAPRQARHGTCLCASSPCKQ